MRDVFIVADSIVSPLGNSGEANYHAVRSGQSGIQEYSFAGSDDVFFLSSMRLEQPGDHIGNTLFESLCIQAVSEATKDLTLRPERTLFILSTTKGNIDLVGRGKVEDQRLNLFSTAKTIAGKFNWQNVQVVSNACISGVLALIVGKRFIRSGKVDHTVIVGADIVSRFVVSGFQSLQALSNQPCRPFDAQRSGISLGEGAGVMVLSADHTLNRFPATLRLSGEGVSNDANHISGPSRTGEELAIAINSALSSAKISAATVDFVSAHGTGTIYNDEMEAKAFELCGMEKVPVNSLKGYYGHTLGAAGIIESIIGIRGLIDNKMISTKGFQELGVSRKINVCKETAAKEMSNLLKTASGFGGCNAAVVFEKIKD